MASDEQNSWVQRVLGVRIPGTGAGAQDKQPAREWLGLFRDAKEEVDAALEKLGAEMRGTGDPDFERIADYGLYGMTNGEGVGLMKALMQLQSATPDKQEALTTAARAAAAAYKAAVFKHPLADLVDANPFGVAVGLKAKLGPALDRIANAS